MVSRKAPTEPLKYSPRRRKGKENVKKRSNRYARGDGGEHRTEPMFRACTYPKAGQDGIRIVLRAWSLPQPERGDEGERLESVAGDEAAQLHHMSASMAAPSHPEARYVIFCPNHPLQQQTCNCAMEDASKICMKFSNAP